MSKNNFYCKNISMDGFSIEEWNNKFNSLIDSNLLEDEPMFELNEVKCTSQCFDCMADIGE